MASGGRAYGSHTIAPSRRKESAELSYIVVIDQRKARNGKYIERIGYYNPRTEPSTEVVKEDRALYWLSVGAQPSDAVRRIFEHTGTWERFLHLRNGEALEDLLREADANKQELPSQKTSQRFENSKPQATPDPVTEPNPKPQPEPIPEPEPEPIVEPEPEPIVEPKPESIVEPEPEPIANPIPDPPPEPEPAPIPAMDDESQQPEDGETKEPSNEALENKALLYGDLNRPGMTGLVDEFVPPSPSANPERRANEVRKRLAKSRLNEPVAEQRTRQVMIKVWDGKDPETREYLEQQYGGKCQICGEVFPKRDGKPYFEALYLESYKTASWLDIPENTLCLCPNHLRRFLHGHRVFNPDFRQQVLTYAGGETHEVSLELCGEPVVIRFPSGILLT